MQNGATRSRHRLDRFQRRGLTLARIHGSTRRRNALATFRRKNALADIGRLTLSAADMIFGGDFALVHSRARGELAVPA